MDPLEDEPRTTLGKLRDYLGGSIGWVLQGVQADIPS